MPGPSLQQVQRLGLQQVLAPHMQLSLHLLQVPTIELRDLIKQELEKNPTLEEVPDETISLDAPAKKEDEGPRDGRTETESEFREEFEALKQLDDEWRDYFNQSSRMRTRSTEEEERRQFFFDSIVQPESLQQHVQGQLRMADASDAVLQAAEIIIGSLNDDGYLLVHEDLSEELVDFALRVCAGLKEASPAATEWARNLVDRGLSKKFESSRRTQLIGWRERLKEICDRLLRSEPEVQPSPPASAEATSPGAAREPIKENIIKLGAEAMDELRRDLAEKFRAAINEDAELPVPESLLTEAASAGSTPGEIQASLAPGQRLDLTLLCLRPSPEIDLDTMHEALALVQTFHPVGVGARTLQECLLIQLRRFDKADGLEARIVREHFNLLANRDVPKLAQLLAISVEQVQQILDHIAQLEPKPGRIFNTKLDQYIEPDVMIAKVKDDFVIILNDERIPHLRISDTYREMMAQENVSTEVVQYVRERIQAGKFLIRSIAQRKQTIYNIASEILAAQREFFEQGPGNLKPLRMSDIAYRCGETFKKENGAERAVCPYCGARCDIRDDEQCKRKVADCPDAEKDEFNRRRHRFKALGREVDNPRSLGVHETTVSRAIANKYMATPHGIFELKYFFTPGYQTAGGEAISNTRVKDLIASIIEKENPGQPLSDQEIVEILKQRGLDIARRTVAKYRGELKIAPSNLRKKYDTASPAPAGNNGKQPPSEPPAPAA